VAKKGPKKAALAYPRLAAIDIGSNAMRMVIAEMQPGFHLKPLKSIRSAVRLGQDVFTTGVVQEATLKKACQALAGFSDWLKKYSVTQVLAVATSAAREAKNQKQVFEAIRRESGVEVQLLPGEEEARLVYLAVQRHLPLGDRSVLVVDIGGGSVELIVGQGGQVRALESLKMGTVRILARLGAEKVRDGQLFIRRAREYIEATRGWVQYFLAEHRVEVMVATGGNAEALAELAQQHFHRPFGDQISKHELDQLVALLESMSADERRRRLGLRVDRADVILPAALVFQSLMHQAGASQLVVPGVGLKDGLLEELRVRALGDRPDGLDRDQVIAACLQLGRKYDFDEEHARQVADLSLQLFDGLLSVHRCRPTDRLLLEAAGLLHDIGKFINFSGHHKHSHYIILSSPMVGLTQAQRHLVAALARYHRKTVPGLQHEFFRQLSEEDRGRVMRLSALLRLAEALDAEHGGMVRRVQVLVRRNRVQLSLHGQGDLALERWLVPAKFDPLEKALGIKVGLSSEA